jgi:hypothetical protein
MKNKMDVCANFENLSYQIKNAFEVPEKVCEAKENREQSLGDMLNSNTSNLRRNASPSMVRSRKKQFISAVIQKFNFNLKRKKQSKSKANLKKTKLTMNVPKKELLLKVGLGLSPMEYFYIQNDLQILAEQGKTNLKFLGKVLGRRSDYYVIYGGEGVGLDGGASREVSLKDQRRKVEPEGVGLNRFEVWVARHNRMVGGTPFLFLF